MRGRRGSDSNLDRTPTPTPTRIQLQLQLQLGSDSNLDHQTRTGCAPLTFFPSSHLPSRWKGFLQDRSLLSVRANPGSTGWLKVEKMWTHGCALSFTLTASATRSTG